MKSRISPRKSGYDYTSPGGYFITICTKDREHYFGKIENGYMKLNHLGNMCVNEIKHIEISRKHVEIHRYVVMPNHIHMIIVLGEWNTERNIGYVRRDDLVGRPDDFEMRDRTDLEPVPTIVQYDEYVGPTLGQIVNVYKGNVSKFAKSCHIPFARQGRYYDRIIRNHSEYERIAYYIDVNPENRKKDMFYE